MSNSQNGRPSLKKVLKATTVGGLAALVEVTVPQVPSFANVVKRFLPPVSIRV